MRSSSGILPLLDVAFKGLWGTLQLLDSQIMEEAVHRATEKGIPVLPVHDELVGPVSKKAEIKQILIDSFHEVTQGKFRNGGADGTRTRDPRRDRPVF